MKYEKLSPAVLEDIANDIRNNGWRKIRVGEEMELFFSFPSSIIDTRFKISVTVGEPDRLNHNYEREYFIYIRLMDGTKEVGEAESFSHPESRIIRNKAKGAIQRFHKKAYKMSKSSK